MIEWIFKHLGIVIFLAIFLSQIVRAVMRSRRASEEHEVQHDDAAEARRVRDVQEQIRRRIAERRAGGEAMPHPASTGEQRLERPAPRPETTQMPEFGGPLGRMLEELQKRAQPPPPAPPPPVVAAHNTAELQRQQRLADEIKALEESRMAAQRRAAAIAVEESAAVATAGAAKRSAAREHLLEDLSDTTSLRRAIVLREVLGAPVGLR